MLTPHPRRTSSRSLILSRWVRRVVAARVRDPQLVDDLVQETLVRVMAARVRVEADKLAPYAAVTARDLVASVARNDHRARRMAHLLADPDVSERPEDGLLRDEESAAVAAALARLAPGEREMLLAHEVHGQDTATLAATERSTPGAIGRLYGRWHGAAGGRCRCGRQLYLDGVGADEEAGRHQVAGSLDLYVADVDAGDAM